MTASHYIGAIIGVIGLAFVAYGEFKNTISHMTFGAFFVLGGLLIAGIAGLPIKEKPSVKVGQVWLIGDDNPFVCDTVEVLKVSEGYVLYADVREIRFQKEVDELRELYNDNRFSYNLHKSSCSIEKFVIDGRRVK